MVSDVPNQSIDLTPEAWKAPAQEMDRIKQSYSKANNRDPMGLMLWLMETFPLSLSMMSTWTFALKSDFKWDVKTINNDPNM